MSTNSSSKRCTRRSSRVSPAEAVPRTAAQSSRPHLEASDDEVQMWSSPRRIPQARNQSRRRNRPVIVVVDDERESHSGTRGIRVNGPVTVATVNHRNKRQRIPPNRTIINCENYPISEDGPSSKSKKVSTPVPEKVVPKEPTFGCPICMGPIVSPCSTSCGHIFCEGCIKSAIEVKRLCPTCRTKLAKKNSFHKVFLPSATND
ncbi:uncharacterized protein A4U43_C02F4430 [Asparagus officinalis]|uniref:RING-type domain-containing protein n=1 Tax=Asparagus officinalis TaxID=4686 RepID=A0A5P1FKM2_ASPOF|nr:E3 ubiquitin-protein ligase RNF4-like [Asparagus officinalis]ONK77231.1 uncharacterized protein A4U43_C02F4430 [Asparagus officinalis]